MQPQPKLVWEGLVGYTSMEVPARLVTPPRGLERGYVPIAVRQKAPR